jgi:hypothetical protein
MLKHWLAFASTVFASTALATVPIPVNDPFYKQPAGFENDPPGTGNEVRSWNRLEADYSMKYTEIGACNRDSME